MQGHPPVIELCRTTAPLLAAQASTTFRVYCAHRPATTTTEVAISLKRVSTATAMPLNYNQASTITSLKSSKIIVVDHRITLLVESEVSVEETKVAMNTLFEELRKVDDKNKQLEEVVFHSSNFLITKY